MIAAVFKDVGIIKIENEYPVRKLNNGEVLVNVMYCGVCGTDKHIYEGKAAAKKNIILGHEYSGVVADKAKDVAEFEIGDKVAVDPNIYCGKCNYCRQGKTNFCKNHEALGVTLNGGFAEYSIVPSSQVYVLPKEIDLSIAAFAEPLSCCLRGIQHADIKHGNSVAIIGGGTIGLMMVQLAKSSGAAKVILLEPEKNKRELGLILGADLSINSFEKDIERIINDYTCGGADVVIECAGKKEAVELSIKLAAKGGRVVLFGLSAKGKKANLDLQYLFHKEIQIHNSFLNPFTFTNAVDLIASNKINLSKLVSDRINLINIQTAFTINNNSQFIKYQVTTNSKE